MKTVKISALCPYEIGDKITVGREIHPPGLAFRFPAEERTITDIVCPVSYTHLDVYKRQVNRL